MLGVIAPRPRPLPSTSWTSIRGLPSASSTPDLRWFSFSQTSVREERVAAGGIGGRHPVRDRSNGHHGGRYAFGNQSRIAHWNLVRLAEALLPLFADNEEDAARVASEHLQR